MRAVDLDGFELSPVFASNVVCSATSTAAGDLEISASEKRSKRRGGSNVNFEDE